MSLPDGRHGVLITRPQEAAQGLAQAIADLGYRPVINPLLQIVPLDFALPADRYDAVFITSAAAIRPMAERVDKRTSVFTVGETTCDAAIAAGFIQTRCIGQTVAEALQSLAPRPKLPLLYLSGTHSAADDHGLPDNFIRVPVYDTRRLPLEKTTIDLLYAGQIGWIVLFSRRTAEALAMAVDEMTDKGWMGGVGLVCLSERTAYPVQELPWRRIDIAAQPTADAVLSVLPRIG